jgi:hypothetical protein
MKSSKYARQMMLFAGLLPMVISCGGPRQETIKVQPIEIVASFPGEELSGQSVFLNGALYFAHDDQRTFFISNTREGNILRFDAEGNYVETIGRKGQGPGELSYINDIMVIDDEIAVQDIGNHKIQFFSKEGKPRDSFRTFKTYRGMAYDKKRGLIYAAPMLSRPDEELVDVLDLNGKLIRSFGKPLEFERKWTQLNMVNLSLTDGDELLLAFVFFPIIRKYSQEGNLLTEKHIDYGPWREKEANNIAAYKDSLASAINPSFYAVMNAIRNWKRRLFILSLLPERTILELDAALRVKSVYLDANRSDYFAVDFIVSEDEGGLKFYVLQVMPENVVDVFGYKKY